MTQAYANYRSAVILLAKFGFQARDVWAMTHAEVSAWIDSYLDSQGVKRNDNSTHYNLLRRKRAE